MKPFPDHPFLKGNFAPVMFEADAPDLPIRGELPKDLAGTLYRNGPNPQFPPRGGQYHWFVGDGMIHAFQVENGRVSYRNRWVKNNKWKIEHEAGEALWAGWSPMASDPSVRNKDSGGVANTNIVWHGGKLLALEEAHLPFALDPVTLDPRGAETYGGKLATRMTAHPKLDPETGELVFFAYSAGGYFTKTMHYGTIDRNGVLTRLDTFEAPYSAMVHDFLVTENYVLLPVMPLTGSMERAMSGKPGYAWEKDKRTHIGVLKRSEPISSLRWFEADPFYVFHYMNAYEKDGKLIADAMQYKAPPLFPDPEGRPGDPADAEAYLHRWTLDLAANSNAIRTEKIDDLSGDFPRLDERKAGLAYRHGFFAVDSGGIHRGFDLLAHLDLATGKRTVYRLPPGDVTSEPVFVPRKPDAAEGDGYLLATIYRGEEKRSDLAVFDAGALDKGPLAVAELSTRVPYGFHGNWRPAA